MSKKNNQNNQYINDLSEWQNKMYQPGEYLGGKIPPAIKYGGKKLGYFILIIGVMHLLPGIILIVFTADILSGSMLSLFGIGLVLYGYFRIIKSK